MQREFATRCHSASARLARACCETLEQRRLLSVTIDFEEAPIGRLEDAPYEEAGFRFEHLSSHGSDAGAPFIYGAPQGYESRVLHPVDWGNQIRITRSDGAEFDIERFDYAAGRWGEAMDFRAVGVFEDGSTQIVTGGSGTKSPSTLELDWSGLTSLSVMFAGGENNAYGALDNFVFGGEADLGDPSLTGSIAGDDLINGPAYLSYDDRNWDSVDHLIPLPSGQFYSVGRGAASRLDPGFLLPQTSDVRTYLVLHNADGSIDTSFGDNGGIDFADAPQLLRDAEQLFPIDTGFIATYPDGQAAKLTPSFTLDTSYGDDGYVNYADDAPGVVTSLDVSNNGHLAVAISGDMNVVVSVYTPEGDRVGQIEPAPDANGKTQGDVTIRPVGIDGSGRLYVGFRDRNVTDGPYRYPFGAIRYNAELTLDTAWADGGFAVFDSYLGDWEHPVQLDAADDGRLMMYTLEDDLIYRGRYLDANGQQVSRATVASTYDVAAEFLATSFLDDGSALVVTQGDHNASQGPLYFDNTAYVLQFHADGDVDGDIYDLPVHLDAPDRLSRVEGAFVNGEGDIILGGFQYDYEQNSDGQVTDITRSGTLWRVQAPAAGETVIVDFEGAPLGNLGGTPYEEDGFRFTPLPSYGGTMPVDAHIFGQPQGYDSKVLHPASFADQILVTRADGGEFDIQSFDYAAGRWTDFADLSAVGMFADGSTQTLTAGSGSQSLSTLDLGWTGLTSLSIRFAGGTNDAWGAVDNFVFGGEADFGGPSVDGSLTGSRAIVGPAMLSYDERNFDEVLQLLPLADGRFYTVGRSGSVTYEQLPTTPGIPREKPATYTYYVTRHHADGTLDVSFGGDGRREIGTLAAPGGEPYDLEPDTVGGFIGFAENGGTTYVLRLDSELNPRSGFGTGGVLAISPALDSPIVLPEGGFAGYEGNSDGLDNLAGTLRLYDADGSEIRSRDFSFLNDTYGFDAHLMHLGADAQGRIYVAYQRFYSESGDERDYGEYGLVRLDSDLSIDPSYGTDGRMALGDFGFPSDGKTVRGLWVDADGDAVLYVREADGDVEIRAVRDEGAFWRSVRVGHSEGGFLAPVDIDFLDDNRVAVSLYSSKDAGPPQAVWEDWDSRVNASVVVLDDQLNATQYGTDPFSGLGGFPDALIPTAIADAFVTAEGHLVLGGWTEDFTYADNGDLADVDHLGALWKVDPSIEPRQTVDFEEASTGNVGLIYTEDGFRFRSLTASGGGPLEDLLVYGPADGFATNVLHPQSWGRTIRIDHLDGEPFHLVSLDYAGSVWGDSGDFVLTGTFADGSTQSLDRRFSGKMLTTLNLGWRDLERVEIMFAGGVSNAYGSIDNLVFAA